jgi:hypothetical protein
MNIFTKKFTDEQIFPLTCKDWQPGHYNLTEEYTLLDLLKLNHKNKSNVMLDPVLPIEMIIFNDGWNEVWDLIEVDMQFFINQNGPTKGMNLSLKSKEERIHAYKLIFSDIDFVRKDFRLYIVNLAEKTLN